MVTRQPQHILHKLCLIGLKLHLRINQKKNLGKDTESKSSFLFVVMKCGAYFLRPAQWFGVEGGEYSPE